jgi:hypothetical protein
LPNTINASASRRRRSGDLSLPPWLVAIVQSQGTIEVKAPNAELLNVNNRMGTRSESPRV